jgi:hypothetical protein
MYLRLSPFSAEEGLSIEILERSPASFSLAILGRLFVCMVRVSVESDEIIPGPTDLRGGFPTTVLETGG